MERLLIVDDHKMIRDAIKLYFEDSKEYQITGEASDGVEALDLLDKNNFDLIISDIDMPNMDGMKLTEEVHTRYPELPILILTMFNDISRVKKLIELGVDGFVLKNVTQDELFKAIGNILKGGNYYSREVYATLIDNISNKSKKKQRTTLEQPLSDREKEILYLIAHEYSNQEIADKLFISRRTVETHKVNLLGKTGCKNVAGLVMYAVENEIV